jgi:DNA-binding CsgD family transcriptional regulator/sugar-specific transcriptional regulator TrmB
VLQPLGVSPDTESVYRLMLLEPTFGVEELAEHLELPEEQVRAALDELARLSLARESRDHPGRLRAVEPNVAFDTMLRQHEHDVAQRLRTLADRRAAAAAAVAEYSTLLPNHPEAGSERLVGLDAVQARLEELGRELTSECLSVMPGGAQSQASLDASRPLDQHALAEGIELLTLYQDSARNDPTTYAYARWMTENGGQVHTAPIIPPRMLIFDRRAAIVPIDPTNTRLGALCTREPPIVASLIAIFRQAWSNSVPLGALAVDDSDTGLTMLEKQLLTLLGAGMTDAAVGNRLGISARTVRRQMAALMERLGATSRFEAGLKAARQGWL